MELERSAKIVKYLLVLQILIVVGIGMCEIMQLAEIDKSQQPTIQHPEDWNYMMGYTSNKFVVIMRVYYWLLVLISIGILGWSLDSFEKRWKNIYEYSDNSRNVTLLISWCIATTSSVIFLSASNGIKPCSESSYSYTVTQRLLRHCNAYLASLLLAYVLTFTIIIQILFHYVIIKHYQRKVDTKKPPSIQEPTEIKIRRSRRVNKKRSSLRSSAAFSMNSTRLSIVTEDEEEKSVTSNKSKRSDRSDRSNRSNRSNKSIKSYHSAHGEFSNESQVNSNV